MKLAIYTCATTGYAHALTAQARRIVSAIALEKRFGKIRFYFVTDDIRNVEKAAIIYQSAGIDVDTLITTRKGGENYQTEAQLLIADMRQMASTAAMAWGADFCLSLDSDVLPPANFLRCSMDMLEFDGGFYSVAFCPYPSQGGGAFLGGHGTPNNPILPDFHENEKDVPPELLEKRDLLRATDPMTDAVLNELHEIEKEIRAIPPKMNVFAANALKWRRRGWFDFAYPAIGRGAVVPVEWIGFGCTLMNRHALSLCDWTGYDGKGTEDLFINFRRWHPSGLRIACIPHCPCDHVIRDKETGGHVLVATGHATDEEHTGHLRQWRVPWIPQN